LTRERIIRRAFSRIGVDSPSTSEKAVAAEVLDDVIAEQDPEGRWLWTISNTETSLTLTSGTRSYSVGTGSGQIPSYIQNLQTCVIERAVTDRLPLQIISKSESIDNYELETETGEPYMVYLERAADPADQKLHFLPTPDSAYTIKFTYQRMLYDFDSASSNPDVLRSMRLGLIKILSHELAPSFGVSLNERQILMGEADLAKALFKKHNSERKSETPAIAEYF
jgi:hypothetical protein